jgi:hypothetical protein
MAKYPFLSDEWVAEARRIYGQAEAAGAISGEAAPAQVRVNLVVTEVPFSGGVVDAHVDTSAGGIALGTGHLTGPDVTVSLDYATARALFVSGDVQGALQAFLTGRIKVDGDLTKLLDPRSGIWPGVAGAGVAGAGVAGAGAAEAASGPAQPGLGVVAPNITDVATQLQAITE